jgi:hypothetical protein
LRLQNADLGAKLDPAIDRESEAVNMEAMQLRRAQRTGTRMAKSAAAALCCLAVLLSPAAMRRAQAAPGGETLGIEFVPPAPAGGGRWAIYLDGRIDESAAQRLRDELARQDVAAASVFLNSPGGLLHEGMELGRVIREHGFSAHVGRQSEDGSGPRAGDCFSACVFALLGGSYRFATFQSRIGVHRFFATTGADADPDRVQVVSAAVMGYIKEMGVDVGLFERMSRAGKDQILILTKKDVEQLGVVNNGRMPAQWEVEASAGAAYLKGTQRTWQGSGSVLLSCKDGQVVFQPYYYAGDAAAQFVDSAEQQLIRFGDSLVPLAEARSRTLSIQDGYVSGEFALSPGQVRTLQNTGSVGYAAQLRGSSAFVGFSVDTAGGGSEKIRSFLKGCG